MMKALKAIGVILLLLILALVGVGMFLPAEFGMERSTTINAPAHVIYAQVNDLKNWEKWSPWKAQDPDMKITYSEPSVGEGAWYSWVGESTGTGKLTILETSATAIKTNLEFEGEAGAANGLWKFEQGSDGVKVTWSFKGTADNFVGKYMGLLIDNFLGETFENGLKKLKEVAEAAPPIQEEVEERSEGETNEGGEETEGETEEEEANQNGEETGDNS